MYRYFRNLILFGLILTNHILLSQDVSFSNQIVIANKTNDPTGIFNADLDGDGDQDLVSSSFWDYKIAWYENLGGTNGFGPQQIISTQANGASSVFCADIDTDGDIDVVSTSSNDNEVTWYENTNGLGSFDVTHIIAGNVDTARLLYCMDVENDGDMDIIVGYGFSIYNKLIWFENIDGLGNFNSQVMIDNSLESLNTIECADVNSDGYNDILISCWWPNTVSWYENLDGSGFGSEQIISNDLVMTSSACCADVDGDNDLDVLASFFYNGEIAWFENLDGQGNFGTYNIVATYTLAATYIQSADIDNDGDMDILCHSDISPLVWIENMDGNGNFVNEHPINVAGYGSVFGYMFDYDNDSDEDLFCMEHDYDKISYLDNIDGLGNFGQEVVITMNCYNAKSVISSDLDHDGDYDVISGSAGLAPIAWYDNLDGLGTLSDYNPILTDVERVSDVMCKDINGDNYDDIVYISDTENEIGWLENINGEAIFGDKNIVDYVNNPISFDCIDIDMDNDNDIVTVLFPDNKIIWYENLDGNGNFSDQILIADEIPTSFFLSTSDIDNDGDYDIFFTSYSEDFVGWLENIDGFGTFGDLNTITTDLEGPSCLYFIDIDMDSDKDLVVGAAQDNTILWYENTDGSGNFGAHYLITNDAEDIIRIHFCDFDNDGDQDLLAALCDSNEIAWFENLDGLGTFDQKQVIWYYALDASSVYTQDLDNDGFQDVLSASSGDNIIAWYRNETGTSISPWEDPQSIPNSNVILTNYPNPFNPETTISFNFNNEQNEQIELSIYNLAGQKVKTLSDFQINQSSNHQIVWNGRDDSNKPVASGIYFVRLKAGDVQTERKILLLK